MTDNIYYYSQLTSSYYFFFRCCMYIYTIIHVQYTLKDLEINHVHLYYYIFQRHKDFQVFFMAIFYQVQLVYISVWLSLILISTLFFVEFDLYLYVHFFLFNSKYCTCIYTCLFTFFQKRLQKELTALMKDPPIGVKVDAESIYKDLSE